MRISNEIALRVALSLQLLALPSLAQDTNLSRASEAITRLEAHFAGAGAPSVTVMAASRGSDKAQEKLNEEHRKAKKDGYDREFHDAIRKNGGERLKEEWKRNCQSRSTKPDQRELNCY